MAFLTCPDMASIAIHATNSGKQISNVLHALFSHTPVHADVDALATAMGAAIGGNYEPLMSDNLLLADVTVTGLTNPVDVQSTFPFGSSPGSASGNPLPANNSLVVTLYSGFTGRSARGRVFSFPTGNSNIASTGGDLYTTGYVTAIEGFWASIVAAIAAAGWTPVILSKQIGGVPRSAGHGYAITSVVARNGVADSQRRRLPKGH